MIDITFASLNKTETVIVNTVEHKFPSIGDESMLPWLRLATLFTFGLILGTNVPLTDFIRNQSSKTFLDSLILLDCFLCLCNTLALIKFLLRTFDYFLSDFWGSICNYHVFFLFFANVCNRLITLGIAFYRLFLVLGSSLMWTSYQKKILEKIILLLIPLLSAILTGCAIYYRENWRNFLGINKNVSKCNTIT